MREFHKETKEEAKLKLRRKCLHIGKGRGLSSLEENEHFSEDCSHIFAIQNNSKLKEESLSLKF